MNPTFFICDIPIYGELILAPMSGYNDQPFRRLCHEFGAALTYTGLLASNAIVHGSNRTERMLRLHPDDSPLVCQLFGNDARIIVQAAQRVEALGAEIIDINLGCPEPKIVKAGHGSALLKDPVKIGRIFEGLTQVLQVPVTGKIRLGWDEDSRNYMEVARVLEENGASLIAVHGRTTAQAYTGIADWDAIAEVKQAVRVPVLASGDVTRTADIPRILAHTGCDAVMIGRASIGNPWIFEYRDRATIPFVERVPIIKRHLQMMVDFHGPYLGIRLFRKHLVGYLRNASIGKRRRGVMLRCDNADHLTVLLEEFAESN